MLSVPGLAAQSSCLRPVWLYSYDSLVWPEAVMRTEGREKKNVRSCFAERIHSQ